MKASSLIFFLIICIFAFSQESGVDVYDLDFNELLQLKVVSVSKTEQNATEIPTTVKVITSEDIKDNGYFTLDEMLSDLPGFQFRNIHSLNSYIFQRGIPNQNNLILILVDGVQINELNSGGFYGGAQYDLNSIEKVEIVYGPSSVSYGTNAISGIINIITKNAKETSGNMSTMAGNFKTLNTSADYNFINATNTFKLRLSGMYKTSQKANLKGENGDYNWTDLIDIHEDDYNFGVKANYKNFVFGINYMNKQSALGAFQKSAGTEYHDFGTLWNIRFLNNYIKYNHQFSDKISWSSILYNRNATVAKNTIYIVTDTAQISYYRPNSQTGLENILNIKFSPNIALTSGILLEYEKLADGAIQTYSESMYHAPPTPDFPVFQKNTLTSIFIEPRFTIYKNFHLSGGLRFDYSTIYDKVLTPRVGAIYNWGKLSTRLSYAEAFRAPKPWDYYDGIGNDLLMPETLKALEFGSRIEITKKVSTNIVCYRNALNNGLTKFNAENGYHWINSGEINTTGLEIELVYSSSKMKAYTNYTYTKSQNEHNVGLAEISMHTANVGATYSISKKLKLNLRTNYVSERKNPSYISITQSSTIAPSLIFNGAITWNTNDKITFQLIGKNIFDSEYYHTSNRIPERYRQAQRTILFNIAYKFYD